MADREITGWGGSEGAGVGLAGRTGRSRPEPGTSLPAAGAAESGTWRARGGSRTSGKPNLSEAGKRGGARMALGRCPCHPRQGGELLRPSPGTLPAPQPLGLSLKSPPQGGAQTCLCTAAPPHPACWVLSRLVTTGHLLHFGLLTPTTNLWAPRGRGLVWLCFPSTSQRPAQAGLRGGLGL